MKKNLLFAVAALFGATMFLASCSKNETAEPIAEIKNEYKYSKIIIVSDEARLVTQTIQISSDDASLVDNFGTRNIKIFPVLKGQEYDVVMNSIPNMFENNTNLPKQEWNPTNEELKSAVGINIKKLFTKKDSKVVDIITQIGYDEQLTRASLIPLYADCDIEYPEGMKHRDKAWFVAVKLEIWERLESRKYETNIFNIQTREKFDLDNSDSFTPARYRRSVGSLDPTFDMRGTFYAKARTNFEYSFYN